MPRFTSYDAPTRVAGAVGGRAATASDFGADIGVATQQLGKSVSEVGDMLAVREERRQVTEARARLSEFKTAFAREETERQQAAPIGAPGHFDATKTSFDDQFAEFSSTLSPIQQRAIAAEAQTARSTALSGSLRFQSEQTVKADLRNVGVIRRDISNQLFSGALSYDEAQAEWARVLEDTTLSEGAKAELKLEALPGFREAIANGALENPIQGSQMLEDGKLDFLEPEERTKFEGLLRTAISGLEKKAFLERKLEFARKNEDLFTRFLAGELTLSQLAAEKGDIPPEIYNHMQSAIASTTIRQRTPAEVQEVTFELMDAYSALNIKKKDGKYSAEGADLVDLLRFHNLVMKRASEGSGINGLARQLLRAATSVIQRRVDNIDGSSWLPGDGPMNYAMDAIEAYEERLKIELPNTTKYQLMLKAVERMGEPGSLKDDEQMKGIMQEVIDEQFRQDNPEHFASDELPTARMGTDGRVALGAAPGSPSVAQSTTRKIEPGNIVEAVDGNGNRAWVRLDENGKPVEVVDPPPWARQPSGDQSLGAPVEMDRPVAGSDISRVELPDPRGPRPKALENAWPRILDPRETPPKDTYVIVDTSEGYKWVYIDENGVFTTQMWSPTNEELDRALVRPPITDVTPESAEQETVMPESAEQETVTPRSGVTPSAPALQTPEPVPSWVDEGVMSDITMLATASAVPLEGAKGDKQRGKTVPTGEFGITEDMEKELAKFYDLEDYQGRDRVELVMRHNYIRLANRRRNFTELQAGVQLALLDLAFNLGVDGVLNLKRLDSALKNAGIPGPTPPTRIIAETFDTIYISHDDAPDPKTRFASGGHAKRRAAQANRAGVPGIPYIDIVRVGEDGSVSYLDRQGNLVAGPFESPGGLPPGNWAGDIKVPELD